MLRCEVCGREPLTNNLKYKCIWRDKYIYFCSAHCLHVWDQNKNDRKGGNDRF